MERLKTPIALFVALAALVLSFAGCGGSPPQATPPAVRHFIAYQAPGWKGVLVVNGIPVELLLQPQGVIGITEWTQTGVNEVMVVVQSDESTQQPFQFQVFAGEKPDASDGKAIGAPVAIAVPTVPETTASGTTFQAPPRADWPWQRAATITELTEQDRREISAVFERFCAAFGGKNVNEVLDVFSTGSSIKSQALGITMDQARKNDAELLGRIFATAGEMYRIRAEDAQVRPFQRGVMIFPTVLDGSMHLLHIENKADPNQSFIFDFLTLCKIDGKWVRVN